MDSKKLPCNITQDTRTTLKGGHRIFYMEVGFTALSPVAWRISSISGPKIHQVRPHCVSLHKVRPETSDHSVADCFRAQNLSDASCVFITSGHESDTQPYDESPFKVLSRKPSFSSFKLVC
ncbi:hypothetical protein AVEN_98425-1 [Araneus ventricosus]|uniref:Uncharacterized protein n=1 Tax=Araneus ventricosus TaxID=182803 RepID=A0A4Y2WDM8_ARAVE|nr:hypothetical protein AVEN_98425-1 [Araneus ventricosus]